jgi:hypothetical protein
VSAIENQEVPFVDRYHLYRNVEALPLGSIADNLIVAVPVPTNCDTGCDVIIGGGVAMSSSVITIEFDTTLSVPCFAT